jgi:lipoprotein-anchoring transpeptidase ErfK/SrfK
VSTSAAACVLMRLDFGHASSSGVRRFGAVVRSCSTPTPSGLFAIYAKARQPVGSELGPWALHLTGHSNVLFNYGGGPGRVAIHGRAGDLLADPIGTARSHGCVRVQNGEISWLAAHVPEGTPVRIRN